MLVVQLDGVTVSRYLETASSFTITGKRRLPTTEVITVRPTWNKSWCQKSMPSHSQVSPGWGAAWGGWGARLHMVLPLATEAPCFVQYKYQLPICFVCYFLLIELNHPNPTLTPIQPKTTESIPTGEDPTLVCYGRGNLALFPWDFTHFHPTNARSLQIGHCGKGKGISFKWYQIPTFSDKLLHGGTKPRGVLFRQLHRCIFL